MARALCLALTLACLMVVNAVPVRDQQHALLEAEAEVAGTFNTDPYKFFTWRPPTNRQRTIDSIITDLTAALNAIAPKCGGATDRCVIVGPEFLVDGRNAPAWFEKEWNTLLARLNTVTSTANFKNILVHPGTIVFQARGSPSRCAEEKKKGYVQPRPADVKIGHHDVKKYFSNQESWEKCLFLFNGAPVVFRGRTLITHFKRSDGGTVTITGPGFDLTARTDFGQRQTVMQVPGWGTFTVETCADHGLKRAATRTTSADVQLSVFYPGSMGHMPESASAKHCGFVIENTNSKNGRLYQVDRSAATPKLLEFGANQQIAGSQVYEFVQTTPVPPIPGCGPAQPGLKRTASTTQIPVKATPRQTEQGQKPMLARGRSQPQIKKGGK